MGFCEEQKGLVKAVRCVLITNSKPVHNTLIQMEAENKKKLFCNFVFIHL